MNITNSAPARMAAGAILTGTLARHPRSTLWLAVFGMACLGQLTAFGTLSAVWSTGAFFDTDDAMRAVQVRDLAAGQGWFDLTAHRLHPPDGVLMHWSRVVDVPLLFLLRFWSWFADIATAERLMRLSFPFFLTVGLFVLLVGMCERLTGPSARGPALVAAFLYGPATGQFEPGRIDHHAPQIVLLVLAVAALAPALMRGRARFAALAGAATSVSLSISVENIPFFAPLVLALMVIWIHDEVRGAPVLAWFAAGSALALFPVYAATIPPSRWLVTVNDALSFGQAIALLATALLLASLTFVSRRFPGRPIIRATSAVVGMAVVFIFVARAFPAVAEKPFAHLDPLVRMLWLDGVDEAQPLMRKLFSDPYWTAGVLAPVFAGFAGTLLGLQRSDRFNGPVWMILLVCMSGGMIASLMMVRTLSPVLALCVPGALHLALAIRDRLAEWRPSLGGPLLTVILLVATSSVGSAAVTSQLRGGLQRRDAATRQIGDGLSATRGSFAACVAPDAFRHLASLPPGLVLAEPDLGAYILAHTPHSVIAGAYHRNEQGMRTAINALLARDEHARQALADLRGTYVVYCRAGADPQYLELAPSSLAAHLARGDVPAYLRHLAAAGAVLDVFAIR